MSSGAFALTGRRSHAQQITSPPTPPERSAMAKLAAAFMGKYAVPGLSIAVSANGRPVYAEAFGSADPEAGQVLTTRHRFRIASITKTLTSVGIFTLIEAGKLRLSDHVFGPNGVLASQYRTPPGREDIDGITLQQLLTHTSGGWPNDKDDPMFLHEGMDHRELIAWTLEHQPLKASPGTLYAYSNFGYCLLGRVIERVTARPYAEFIQEQVVRPCAIGDMRIAGNTLRDRAPDEVRYVGQGGQNPYDMNVARMDSHGGWIASPSDLVRFIAQIDGLNGATPLLKQDVFAEMKQGSSVNPDYAHGLSVNSAGNIWHSGSLPGTETILVRTHSRFCWAALTNTRAAGDGMGSDLDDLVWAMAGCVSGWHA